LSFVFPLTLNSFIFIFTPVYVKGRLKSVIPFKVQVNEYPAKKSSKNWNAKKWPGGKVTQKKTECTPVIKAIIEKKFNQHFRDFFLRKTYLLEKEINIILNFKFNFEFEKSKKSFRSRCFLMLGYVAISFFHFLSYFTHYPNRT
jgi:hypothetical protein